MAFWPFQHSVTFSLVRLRRHRPLNFSVGGTLVMRALIKRRIWLLVWTMSMTMRMKKCFARPWVKDVQMDMCSLKNCWWITFQFVYCDNLTTMMMMMTTTPTTTTSTTMRTMLRMMMMMYMCIDFNTVSRSFLSFLLCYLIILVEMTMIEKMHKWWWFSKMDGQLLTRDFLLWQLIIRMLNAYCHNETTDIDAHLWLCTYIPECISPWQKWSNIDWMMLVIM